MSARIVAQIEALIARLSAAREILATFLPDAEASVHDKRVVTMQARESAEPADRAPAPPVQVTVLKPRERRERRSVARPRSAPTASALAGHIPLQPVAVSPRQLAADRGSRIADEAKDSTTAAPRSALDELMLEIARRSA